MRNAARVIAFLVVLGALFSSIFVFTPLAKANPFTTVTLTLQEEIPEVDVSPGSSGIVELHGNVTCVKYGPDSVRVRLTAQSETGGAGVEPVSMVFEGISGSEETRPYTVSTRIPMGCSCSYTPIVTVSGSYDQGGLQYSIAPVSQYIIILQYYRIEFTTEDKEVTVNSGENAEIELNVVNIGNGEDVFKIDFQNRQYLLDKGFNLPSPMEVQMEEDERKNITLEISASEDVSGTYVAEISVLSKGSLGEGEPEEIVMAVHLEVTGGLGQQIISSILSPLTIIIVVIVIVAVILYRRKRKKEITTS